MMRFILFLSVSLIIGGLGIAAKDAYDWVIFKKTHDCQEQKREVGNSGYYFVSDGKGWSYPVFYKTVFVYYKCNDGKTYKREE